MVAASKVEYFVPDVGVRSAKLRTPTSKDESLSRYEEALLGRELLEKAGMRERHEPPANLFGQDIISKMTPQKGRYDPRRVAALAQPGCRGRCAGKPPTHPHSGHTVQAQLKHYHNTATTLPPHFQPTTSAPPQHITTPHRRSSHGLVC